MRSVLLQLHIGNPKQCNAWENVPVAHGVQLTLYAYSGVTSDVERCARHCFSILERHFTTIGGNKALSPCMEENGQIFPAYTCAGAVQSLNKRVLIYFADGTGQIDPVFEQYFHGPEAAVFPVVDNSFGDQPASVLPTHLSAHIAQRTNNFDITPLIPQILHAAGIVDKGFRLFISYRHDDAQYIAGQLFHKLSERMFDVFLDRFSSRPGDDFVSLVREELYDKACVLVLETEHIGKSKYCYQEVGTATTYHLGLMAIDLPGSKTTFPLAKRRLDLTTAVLAGDGTLQPADLDHVVSFIEQNYDMEIARRPRAQDLSLLYSILVAKLWPQAKGVGQYLVNNGVRDYFVNMCRLPPAIEDFMRIEEFSQKLSAPGILFGPMAVVRTQRAQRINWLGVKSSVRPLEEGHMLRSLFDIASNRI
ncbi:toll/interleukin-1 receptor domain-containing protein [Paraflavisolibacter sp. H34]|uniref:toll/interleukin-1 receptor domain-containing protein n=1 Tax=Huijunlia imazamoxiresistens TaxID=3127457 RepID=UPI00301A2495